MLGLCKFITFAVVVGLQDEEDVLKQRDQSEGVENQRKDTQNVVVMLDSIGESTRIHIQRRRSDVAVHHSDALKSQMQYHSPARRRRLAGHPKQQHKSLSISTHIHTKTYTKKNAKYVK